MTNDTSAASASRPWPAGGSPAPARRNAPAGSGRPGSWLPTWGLIATKHLELRKRRVLMAVVAVLTVGLPVVVLGLRLAFHAVNPHSYGPARPPSFTSLCSPLSEFGFIVAATLGATAGTWTSPTGSSATSSPPAAPVSRSTWPGSRRPGHPAPARGRGLRHGVPGHEL